MDLAEWYFMCLSVIVSEKSTQIFMCSLHAFIIVIERDFSFFGCVHF